MYLVELTKHFVVITKNKQQENQQCCLPSKLLPFKKELDSSALPEKVVLSLYLLPFSSHVFSPDASWLNNPNKHCTSSTGLHQPMPRLTAELPCHSFLEPSFLELDECAT